MHYVRARMMEDASIEFARLTLSPTPDIDPHIKLRTKLMQLILWRFLFFRTCSQSYFASQCCRLTSIISCIEFWDFKSCDDLHKFTNQNFISDLHLLPIHLVSFLFLIFYSPFYSVLSFHFLFSKSQWKSRKTIFSFKGFELSKGGNGTAVEGPPNPGLGLSCSCFRARDFLETSASRALLAAS